MKENDWVHFADDPNPDAPEVWMVDAVQDDKAFVRRAGEFQVVAISKLIPYTNGQIK